MIEELTERDIKSFPTTRYQGSKRKILEWLSENLADLEYTTVLDAFGGTGAVSYMFKTLGKSVTFNDELRFNYHVGKAIIENPGITLSDDELKFITELSEIVSFDNFISSNFSDIYYTDDENLWLDKFLHKLKDFPEADQTARSYKVSLAYFALFQACLTKRPYNLFHRKNLYMRMNKVERNFGNKTTWERSFQEQILKFGKESNNSVFTGKEPCYAINESAFDLENTDYDMVYIDPPYVDINGDHDTIDYLYCYHFLEGMSRYEEWSDLIDYSTKNLRFKKELYSNEFKRRNVHDSFDRLFSKYRDSIIVVSYKKNGIPSIEEVEKLLRKYKNNVVTYSTHYKYALNKQNGNAKDNREVLFIGT